MPGLGGMDSHAGHLNHAQESGSPTQSLFVEGNAISTTNFTDLTGNAVIDFNDFLSPALEEDLDWGQFASMVSSGVGNFDAFLNDDPFKI